MIDGVLVTNRVPAESASRLRRAFQLALGDAEAPDVDLVALEAEEATTADAVSPPSLTAQARVAERQTQAA